MKFIIAKKQIGIWFSYLLFIFSACSTEDEKIKEPVNEIKDSLVTNSTPKSKEDNVEDAVIKTVMSLPEVESANTRIDSITNHEKEVSAIVDEAGDGETDYGVRVGYSNEERFETYYFFYVNPKTFKVKILDIISDSVMLYDDWHRMKIDEKKSKAVN